MTITEFVGNSRKKSKESDERQAGARLRSFSFTLKFMKVVEQLRIGML